MRPQAKNIKGFTLLELLVVILIIGVVSATAFTPYQKWKTEREVRSASIKISSVIRDIYSQVQRGIYAFVQFEVRIEGTNEDSSITVTTKGMNMETFTEYVRNKFDDDGNKQDFHEFDQRCSMDLNWTHDGIFDTDILSVNHIQEDSILIGLPGDGTARDGTVCFSKDGSYYSTGGMFLTGTGETAEAAEQLIICEKTDENSSCSLDDYPDDVEHFFSVNWSRFGSIELEKYFKGEWISQKLNKMKNLIKKKTEKGLTLLEALISTAIVGIGFIAVFQLVNFSVGSIDVSGERTKINYITSMIAEDIIAHKDTVHGVNPSTSAIAIDVYGKPVNPDGTEANVKKFADYLMDSEWQAGEMGKVCSSNKGTFLKKEDIKNIYMNQKTDAPRNKMAKWESIIADDRYLKCKNEKDIKSVQIFKICNSGTGCEQNVNVYDDLYIGRIQINTNGGKKRRFLYFQADYQFRN